MLDINNMKRSDFYYDLPQELIAQTPVEPRNASRMMKINRQTGEVVHDHFYNLCNYLKKGDLLVLNDSKVLPARIYGEREDTGSFIEFLLVEQKENMVWEILCRPGKKAKIGTRFVFGGGKLKAEIIDVLEDGNRIARFECEENFFAQAVRQRFHWHSADRQHHLHHRPGVRCLHLRCADLLPGAGAGPHCRASDSVGLRRAFEP